MKYLFIIIIVFLQLINLNSKPVYVVTTPPLDLILKEITGNDAEIIVLNKSGSSPHTYSPKPSQVTSSYKADALLYFDDNLDGWATNIESKNKVKLSAYLPDNLKLYFEEEHHHEEDGKRKSGNEKIKTHNGKLKTHNEKRVLDPHFWTDPLAVKSILPGLTSALSNINPGSAKTYKKNADVFYKKLDSLHRKIQSLLKAYKGKPVFLFHPSFLYFLKRYDLDYKGSIETSPGKEPSANYIMKLVKKVKSAKTKAIFTEPQLPKGPAKAIAEAAGLPVYLLDPLGGTKNLNSYWDLIIFNANVFAKALK